jgi:hypothetical protein
MHHLVLKRTESRCRLERGSRTAKLAIALLEESAYRHGGQSAEDIIYLIFAAAMPSRKAVFPTLAHDGVARKTEREKKRCQRN